MKSLFSNIALAIAVGIKILTNRYEAGQRWSTDRSYLPGYVQDARYDADPVTRQEIVRKSRYFERNNGIVQRLVDLFEQYTVGPQGLQFIPASTDEKWNARAQEWWDQWCHFADLISLHPFSTLQSLIARTWFIDGEIFILKTRGESKPGQPARPRIQLIEGHRVETPGSKHDLEGKTIIDGVEVYPKDHPLTGRPVAYWVRNGLEADNFERIPAERIIHIFEPSRPGQYRGLPFCYAVLNDLHDLDDLQILEMRACKDAAEISNVVQNAAGEINANQVRQNRVLGIKTTATGVEMESTAIEAIAKKLPGRTVATRPGETIEQFRSERPSIATREYWDYLTAKVCAGVGISKLLVFPHSIQGTVARGDYDVANTFFRSRSAVLAEAFKQIYFYVMDWANRNERTLADPPSDWRNVNTCAPRSVNVDVGRNSTAMLAELEAGATTYEDVWAPLGKNWMERLRQKAIERAYINSLAKEFALMPGEIAASAAVDAQALADSEADREEEDNEEVAA